MTDNDQAAAVLAGIMSTFGECAEVHPEKQLPMATFIMDAIRKGDVPGVYCSSCDFHDLWKSAEKDLESLRAEVARLKLDVRDAKQAADYNRTCWGNEKARADKATAERDHLRARLQTIQHSAWQAGIGGNDWQREIKLIKNICDAARAEVRK